MAIVLDAAVVVLVSAVAVLDAAGVVLVSAVLVSAVVALVNTVMTA